MASLASDDAKAAATTNNEPAADDNIYVEPLVQLEKVKVVTNEEDEEILFQNRAKLYVFIKEDVYGGEKRSNYWKERGLGDIKVLKHRENGKCRVVMRQEKTLKVCSNFRPQTSSPLVANTTSKSWLFHAFDPLDTEEGAEEGGEGSASPELKQYAVKFKTQEIANEFKEKFEVAQKANEENGGDAPSPAKDDASKSDSKDIDDAKELDALIAKRNAREKTRRSSVAAQNALKDSDYDSDEEDVDEGNEAELRAKYKFGDDAANKEKEEGAAATTGDKEVAQLAADLDKTKV